MLTPREFYLTLTEQQRKRVEAKLDRMLRDRKGELDEHRVHDVRCQIASDLYQILKG